MAPKRISEMRRAVSGGPHAATPVQLEQSGRDFHWANHRGGS